MANIKYLKDGKIADTQSTLNFAFDYANKNHIEKLLISSTTGFSARLAFDSVPDTLQLIIVTHVFGYIKNGELEFDRALYEKIKQSRHIIFSTAHLFKGLSGFFQKKYGGANETLTFADGLRLINPSIKVAAEISLMAADSGFVNTEDPVLVATGDHRGLNTLCLVKPTTSNFLSEFVFYRLLCFPNKF